MNFDVRKVSRAWFIVGIPAFLIMLGASVFLAERFETLANICTMELIANAFCFCLVWAIAIHFAGLSFRYLYVPHVGGVKLYTFRDPKPERLQMLRTVLTLRAAAASYVLSIYGFALAYRYMSSFSPGAFGETKIDGVVTALYFSIVTMATVGYGDITPKLWYSRILVSVEILQGVAFSIFFFSIVAGIVREGLAQNKQMPRA